MSKITYTLSEEKFNTIMTKFDEASKENQELKQLIIQFQEEGLKTNERLKQVQKEANNYKQKFLQLEKDLEQKNVRISELENDVRELKSAMTLKLPKTEPQEPPKKVTKAEEPTKKRLFSEMNANSQIQSSQSIEFSYSALDNKIPSNMNQYQNLFKSNNYL